MNKVTTDADILGLEVKGKRYSVTLRRHLSLEVNTSGRKAWYASFTLKTGKRSRYSFGTHPETNMAKAIEYITAAIEVVESGGDPKESMEIKKTIDHGKLSPGDITFGDVTEHWLDHYVKEHYKNPANVLHTINKNMTPVMDIPVDELSIFHVSSMAMNISKSGRKPTAFIMVKYVKTIWLYGQDLGLIDQLKPVPVPSKMSRIVGKSKPRTTKLSDLDEIKAFMATIDQLKSKDTRDAIKILLMLGFRKNELIKAECVWFDLIKKVVTLPEWFTKQQEEHTLPLSDAVIELIRDRVNSGNKWMFPSPRRNGEPRSHIFVDDAIRTISRTINANITPHSLRRTLGTSMGEILSAPPHLIDRILGHKIGNDITITYNQAKYLNDMKEPLEQWHRLLLDHE